MTIKDIVSPEGWHPAIGDPYAVAWIITGAYFVVAWMCFRTAFAGHNTPGDRRMHRLFWMGAGAALALLGINKQLDLQIWFIQLGKVISIEQGWYAQRRLVQAFFSLLLLGGGAGVLVSVLVVMKGRWNRFRTPIAGLVLLGIFVILRASAFSHVHFIPDAWLALGPIRARWILELGGILMVGKGASGTLRKYTS